jgi:hypothetical protein
MSDLDLEAIQRDWLVRDYGLVNMGCNCPPGDPRSIIAKLVGEVQRLRGDLTEQGDRLRETLTKRDELRERLECAATDRDYWAAMARDRANERNQAWAQLGKNGFRAELTRLDKGGPR